jgi:hypothetical protein
MKRQRRTLLTVLQMRANHLNRNEDVFKSLTVVVGTRVQYLIDIKMMLKVAFSAAPSWPLRPAVTPQGPCSTRY